WDGLWLTESGKLKSLTESPTYILGGQITGWKPVPLSPQRSKRNSKLSMLLDQALNLGGLLVDLQGHRLAGIFAEFLEAGQQQIIDGQSQIPGSPGAPGLAHPQGAKLAFLPIVFAVHDVDQEPAIIEGLRGVVRDKGRHKEIGLGPAVAAAPAPAVIRHGYGGAAPRAAAVAEEQVILRLLVGGHLIALLLQKFGDLLLNLLFQQGVLGLGVFDDEKAASRGDGRRRGQVGV